MVPGSPNFSFLTEYDPRLVVTAARAERALSYGDPVAALVHLRSFTEFLAKGALTELGGRLEPQQDQTSRLRELRSRNVDEQVLAMFHSIRRTGNEAAHDGIGTQGHALQRLKIAAEVAATLGVPHANVEFGHFEQGFVSLSESFLTLDESMIHGNELLFLVDRTYPVGGKTYHRTREHTLESIREALIRCDVQAPAGWAERVGDAFGLFVGYVLLDALVGNTDRHHENWAVRMRHDGAPVLTPSYDHASSLGRELRDERREHLLTTADTKGDIRTYCRRATSAIFAAGRPDRALTCIEAFEHACATDPAATEYWRSAIRRISSEELHSIVDRVPNKAISSIARTFVKEVLRLRLEALQELAK